MRRALLKQIDAYAADTPVDMPGRRGLAIRKLLRVAMDMPSDHQESVKKRLTLAPERGGKRVTISLRQDLLQRVNAYASTLTDDIGLRWVRGAALRQLVEIGLTMENELNGKRV